MANRALFGGAVYRTGRASLDGSAVFSAAPPAPRPNLPPFLVASERRQPPRGEASSFYAPRPATIAFDELRRFTLPGEPYRRLYNTAISMIRGSAGAAAAVVVPPAVPFLTTPPAFSDRKQDSSAWFMPNILEYDPFGGGAWINTPLPFKSQIVPYRQESTVMQPPIILPVAPQELRVFIAQTLTYANPHRREGSTTVQPAIPSVFFPYEVPRFLQTLPMWRDRQSTLRDSSGSFVRSPQPADGSANTVIYYDIHHFYTGH